VLTYWGDEKLFQGIKDSVEAEVPLETIEWKRNYGRASKNVVISPKFVRFEPEQVTASNGVKSMIGQPILHTFWIECTDIDTYKNSAKDEIMDWMNTLKKCGTAHDWMVVLVETPESRKGANKLLPRTSVVDRLRTDVGTKFSDRCLTLTDPARIKIDSRASESWQTVLHRIRLLLLQAYNRTLIKFEENMRAQREKRNDPKWNFCDYFLLQEELSFVYEMLGVFDEALVQYDELDALFTQFVLNSNVTESPQWLEGFYGNFTDWTGLSLQKEENLNLRKRILGRSPSLLDVRNYMFARQSQLLLQMNKPWEVARRCLSFLHNGVQELSILDINCPQGSVACWVLLSALEVLQTCRDFSQNSTSTQVQQYCFYTAELWSYCREKMLLLGELCGLLPNCQPTSQQLHFVVELSSGIRDKMVSSSSLASISQSASVASGTGSATVVNTENPVDRLKEALSSKSAFEKYYLELAESAISTYKHIGRIRSARMVGLELAKFYLELGQVQKANGFLVDALKTFENEGWSLLKIQTLTDTAKCYEKLNDNEKLVRTCAQMACAKEFVMPQERLQYCKKFMDFAANRLEQMTTVDADNLVTIKHVSMTSNVTIELDKITPGSEISLHLQVESHFPQVILVDSVSTSLTFSEPVSNLPKATSDESGDKKSYRRKMARHKLQSSAGSSVQRTPSNRSTASTASSLISLEPILDETTGDASATADVTDTATIQTGSEDENRLEFYEHFDYKQDKSLSSVRLVCKNATKVLKRKDSSGSILKDGYVKKSDFTHCFSLSDDGKGLELRPGLNEFNLKTVAGSQVGCFFVNQLSVQTLEGKIDLLAEKWPQGKRLKYSVITEPHSYSISTDPSGGNLWAGFCQEIDLNIFTGSHQLHKDTKICVRGSLGLKIGQSSENLSAASICLRVDEAKAFQTVSIKLYVRADLQLSKDGLLFEHRLIIEDPWQGGAESILSLFFRPPFTASAKMQTALTKKFLQVSLQANYDEPAFHVKNPSVTATCDQNQNISFRLINQANEILDLKRLSPSSFMWEIEPVNSNAIPDELKANVEIYYGRKKAGEESFEEIPFCANFEFKDFKTQFLLRCRIDPAKGGELCRASSICSLSITLEQIGKNSHKSLMYEVLADQAVWAICGRAAGVIDMEAAGKQTFIVEVMPLTGGHLALPKVRLSKYILPNNSAATSVGANVNSPLEGDRKDSSSNMPRLEPFSPGQVYNLSRTSRIHVLPSPSSNTSASAHTGGSNSHLNTSMTGLLATNTQSANQDHASKAPSASLQQTHVSLPYY